jgi:small-conductance mechanosensitive channel
VVLTLTIVVVLGQFGVQTASLIALLGDAGLEAGLALQGTLSNVASGIMLLLLRPFRVYDKIKSRMPPARCAKSACFLFAPCLRPAPQFLGIRYDDEQEERCRRRNDLAPARDLLGTQAEVCRLQTQAEQGLGLRPVQRHH